MVKKYGIEEEVVAQIGHTKFESDLLKTFPFVSETEFKEYIQNASMVITHAGSGAIFNAIKAGKKTIAMARLHEQNEMADDHQTELVKKLSEGGYILDGTYSLSAAWEKVKDFVPRKNDIQNDIVAHLDEYIGRVLRGE